MQRATVVMLFCIITMCTCSDLEAVPLDPSGVQADLRLYLGRSSWSVPGRSELYLDCCFVHVSSISKGTAGNEMDQCANTVPRRSWVYFGGTSKGTAADTARTFRYL